MTTFQGRWLLRFYLKEQNGDLPLFLVHGVVLFMTHSPQCVQPVVLPRVELESICRYKTH